MRIASELESVAAIDKVVAFPIRDDDGEMPIGETAAEHGEIVLGLPNDFVAMGGEEDGCLLYTSD